MLSKKSSIFVTGHKGLVGSAIVRRLIYQGYKNIITIDRNKLDLRDQKKVFNFFQKKKINAVINAAGYVGGIYANNIYKAKFIYDNLAIQNNIIHSCYTHKIKSLIFLGSSCIYPKNAKQPIKEKYLLTGELEKTNEPYAIAKIAGIKMCESYNFQYKTNYKCLMPCNLYGPNDNFDTKNSHFLPALIKKIISGNKYKNKSIEIWGTGKPKREVMHVDDLAAAISFILKKKINNNLKLLKLIKKSSVINVGTGDEHSIADFAKIICKLTNNKNKLSFNQDYPDGTMRKILDSSLIRGLGWKPKIQIRKGLSDTINWYKKKLAN